MRRCAADPAARDALARLCAAAAVAEWRQFHESAACAQGVGYISCKELKQICQNLGEELEDSEVFDMVSEALSNFDGKIYYDGLKKIMLPS